MKLKLPPVIVFFLFALLMYGLANILPFGYFDFFGRVYMTFGLALVAFFVALVALIQFYVQKTTIDPSKPSKTVKLVTNGVYAFTRNPMYLAMLLLLLGWGLWLGNAFNTLLAAGFVGYMNRFQIMPEEETLERIFGSSYRSYCLSVRRWF